MSDDPYMNFAERYDWMTLHNTDRDGFFKTLFEKHDVKSVLDCACGTGRDLILFNSFGLEVRGSDLSESMLKQAREKLSEANLAIPLRRVDFRYLDEHFKAQFDAVVCLTSAIAEPLSDEDTLNALSSMRSVLRDGGILVFDQGQTDAMMKDPPRFDVILNERDRSRLFVMGYSEKQMEIHAFDFIHTENERDFHHDSFRIRTRVQDEWQRLLEQTDFKKVDYFGDWQFTPYDKETSGRLIVAAFK